MPLRRQGATLAATIVTQSDSTVAAEICSYLPVDERYRLATLLRLPSVQAEAYAGDHAIPIDVASKNGRTALLARIIQLFVANGKDPWYSYDAIDRASADGHWETLQWWLDSGLQLRYSSTAMDSASLNNRLATLQWWKDARGRLGELQYTEYSLRGCSPATLQWWRDSGLPLVYDDGALDGAQSVAVLDWWRGSGLALRYSATALGNASFAGQIEILEWWLRSGLELRYSEGSIDNAGGLEPRGDGTGDTARVKVLRWWKKSGLSLKYTKDAMDTASRDGDLVALQWWRDNGLPLKYTENLDEVGIRDVKVLEWWKQSGLAVSFTDKALVSDVVYGEQKWEESGMK
ncbi:hypothetical protein DFJ73DRAFT_320419 [Zopfochytrium polystomum]|nr:hypothetical protein DFJ73DRAFT_320419 [Zopfochytrium polystomum]